MNNQKRSLSAASIVSMIGAMLFAIAAALSMLMPVFSYDAITNDKDNNTFKVSLLDEDTRKTFEKIDDVIKSVEDILDKALISMKNQKSFYIRNYHITEEKFDETYDKVEEYNKISKDTMVATKWTIIAATIAVVALLAVALFVCLGKILQFTGGGRIVAVLFSVIGVLAAAFYLATIVWIIVVTGKAYDLSIDISKMLGSKVPIGVTEKVNIGVGPILMTVFSVVSFIFCLIGNGKSAYKLAPPPANIYNPNSTYNGYNDGFNTNNTAQPPVQPQQPYNSYNPGGYAQPQNPYAPPVQQQNPYAVPVQPQNPYAYPVQPQPARPVSGEGTIPLSQINKGSGVSGEGTIPLSQINKGSGVSGEGTIPLNQINKSSGMSGEGTVPLNRVHSQSGEETVPLNRVRSQSGEGTIPLNMVGTVQKNTAAGTLKCIKGDFPAMSVDLKSDEKIIIGRDPSACSVIVGADRSDVSRTHCSVWYDPIKDSFKIKDTSSNGTFVNGQKLPKDQTVQIPDNSVISLGNGDNQFKIIKN